jgi:hypothetical protein
MSMVYYPNLVSLIGSILITWRVPPIAAVPVPRSSDTQAPPSVAAGSDAWAEALAGVGPLVLLIGEKNTKQLLREANGLPSIVSLSVAPIGLISVLTSMIRLCGSHELRAFLGYEHEPRAAAALETTKANCGGIHAQLVDGRISRTAASDPPSQALAVAYLVGESNAVIMDSLRQIDSCREFDVAKSRKLGLFGSGEVRWCFRVVCEIKSVEDGISISTLIARAMDIPSKSGIQNLFVDVGGHDYRANARESIERLVPVAEEGVIQDHQIVS